MNNCAAASLQNLPDVQSRPDGRELGIQAAGIKGIRIPVAIQVGGRRLATVATFTMSVSLASSAKGTHMSRFLELLESQARVIDQCRFKALTLDMLRRLGARTGAIEMTFPYFITKTAPVSRAQSQLDYEVSWRGQVREDARYSFWMRISVPATSLCPCSKEISAYGAHNQRSIIRVEAEMLGDVVIDELIASVERSASCEVYSLLKRADEKFVTERAYLNPKFAEDLVRDVALKLNQVPEIGGYAVEAENFESIHNHSAFARLTREAGSLS